MDKRIIRHLGIFLGSFLVLVLVMSSTEFVSSTIYLNLIRGLLLLLAGICLLVFGRLVILGLIAKYISDSRALRIAIKLLTLPFLLLGFGYFLFLSSCKFDHWPDQTVRESENIRDTRVYVDYIGDLEAMGASGIGVYQERKIFEGLYQRRLICNVRGTDTEISFVLIDDQTIGCSEDFKKRKVPLPF